MSMPAVGCKWKLFMCSVLGAIQNMMFAVLWMLSNKQGSQQNLETWKTWRFEFYLSSSRNSLEIIPKPEKTWTEQDI